MKIRVRLALFGGLAVAALAMAPANAQTWEASYGLTTTNDYGFKRAAPVQSCPGGGYIAVGSSGANLLQLWCGPFPTNPNDPDVYVVRTNALGNSLWEATYDIGGKRGADIGSSIREAPDGSGFVVTGTTDLAQGHTDVFLMRLDCNGGVTWTDAYTSPNRGNEYGMDVLLPPSMTTGNPFDIVVAGVTRSTGQFACLAPATGGDGLLLRTDAAGVPRWSMSYDLGAEEGFAAVVEAGTSPVKDLVAVGLRGSGTGGDAWIVRASGANGTITPGFPSFQNAADFSSPWLDDFRSVIELTSPPEAGNLLAVGTTLGGGYLLKTTADPCTPLIDQSIANVGIWDVQEVQTQHAIAFPGDLAITGEHFGPTDTDVYLLTLNAANLGPIGGSGRLYGNHTGPFDGGASLHEIMGSAFNAGNGFVIAGVTTSNFEGLGDPQDMYLIKTDIFGNTNHCEATWNPLPDPPKLPVTCLSPILSPAVNRKILATQPRYLNTYFLRPECNSSGGGIGTTGK